MQTRGWIYENYSICVNLSQIYNVNLTPKPWEPLSLAILISIIFQYILCLLVHCRRNTCFQHNVISVFSAQYPDRFLKYCASRLSHKSATNLVRNLRYGPRTRLKKKAWKIHRVYLSRHNKTEMRHTIKSINKPEFFGLRKMEKKLQNFTF